MLTRDLVLARLHRGKVKPRYVDPLDAELLQLAKQLISIFASHEGKARQALDGELKELLGSGTDFLLHRALAKLLLDRCEFETASEIDPETLRQTLFALAAVYYRRPLPEGQPFTFERQEVLAMTAEQLSISVEEVESGLYGDLKSEQVLSKWKPCTAEWLLDRYNVALAQGVLLRATQLVLRLGKCSKLKQRELFRRIKFFRLLHRIQPDGVGGWVIHLDGPLSVFKASGKYGVQMASFLPTLLHLDPWTLVGDIAWGKARRKVKLELSSDDESLRPIGAPLKGQWQPDELKGLPVQFAKLKSDWSLSRRTSLVSLGGQGVLVPDFVFTHQPSGLRVVMEVLGFWRRGSLERRLEELRKGGPDNVLLAVSKQLLSSEEDLDDLPVDVYLFRVTPVARKVLARLEEMRQRSSVSD